MQVAREEEKMMALLTRPILGYTGKLKSNNSLCNEIKI